MDRGERWPMKSKRGRKSLLIFILAERDLALDLALEQDAAWPATAQIPLHRVVARGAVGSEAGTAEYENYVVLGPTYSASTCPNTELLRRSRVR